MSEFTDSMGWSGIAAMQDYYDGRSGGTPLWMDCCESGFSQTTHICRTCLKPNLVWVLYKGSFRLHDPSPRTLHKCSAEDVFKNYKETGLNG